MRLKDLDGVADRERLIHLIGGWELGADIVLELRAMKAERGAITIAFNQIAQRLAALEAGPPQTTYEMSDIYRRHCELINEQRAAYKPDTGRGAKLPHPTDCDHMVGLDYRGSGTWVGVKGSAFEKERAGVGHCFTFCPDCGERLGK